MFFFDFLSQFSVFEEKKNIYIYIYFLLDESLFSSEKLFLFSGQSPGKEIGTGTGTQTKKVSAIRKSEPVRGSRVSSTVKTTICSFQISTEGWLIDHLRLLILSRRQKVQQIIRCRRAPHRLSLNNHHLNLSLSRRRLSLRGDLRLRL